MTKEKIKAVRMLAICCVLTFLCPELHAQFKTKEAPIMTKWAKDVHIEKPHPEYPRPQMTRNEWMNLNGVWEFQRSADLNEKPPFGKKDNADKALNNIGETLKVLIAEERELLSLASETKDEVTVAMISDLLKGQEKMIWMLSAYAS